MVCLTITYYLPGEPRWAFVTNPHNLLFTRTVHHFDKGDLLFNIVLYMDTCETHSCTYTNNLNFSCETLSDTFFNFENKKSGALVQTHNPNKTNINTMPVVTHDDFLSAK